MIALSDKQIDEFARHREAVNAAKINFRIAGTKLQEVCEEAGRFVEGLGKAANNYFGAQEKSWQDSEFGYFYALWIDDLEEAGSDLQSLDVLPDDDALACFEQLSVSPGG